MTLYWWRHWFWITSILVNILIVPAHSLSSILDKNTKENINLNSNSHIKDIKETNKYPLDNVEDFDDVINGAKVLENPTITAPNISIEDRYKSSTDTEEKIDMNKAEGEAAKEAGVASESGIMSIPIRNKFVEDKANGTVSSSTRELVIEMGSLGEYSNQNVSSDVEKAPFTLENVHKKDELLKAESEQRARKSKELSADFRQSRVLNMTDGKDKENKSLEEKFNIDEPEGNISSEALSIENTYFLDAGSISGIVVVAVAVSCAAAFAGVFLYRRRYNNKPQALSEPDLSVYIDDSTIRDNSDEMYSLDNDSFLNSLEAMTIQNYWTDTVKHTKL